MNVETILSKYLFPNCAQQSVNDEKYMQNQYEKKFEHLTIQI